MRRVRELEEVDETDPATGEDPVRVLRKALGSGYEIRAPGDAEEPILAPRVRAEMFSWLAEIRAADELAAVGLKPRNTALFYGPPGTGKTTLAHHLAARLGIPLVMVGPEHIISSGWGDAEQTLTKLFSKLASSGTPCVVFIDELEGLGGSRDKNTSGSADNARTSLMGVLLRKVETYTGYLIGATNRAADIDVALWRRFGLQVEIDLPGSDERFSILRRYGLPYEFADDDLDLLTDLTEGASPALLRNVMEGVKRALVMGPRIKLAISDPVVVFGRIVASVQPPPEIEKPPLWLSTRKLSAMTWPPTLQSET